MPGVAHTLSRERTFRKATATILNSKGGSEEWIFDFEEIAVKEGTKAKVPTEIGSLNFPELPYSK
jgi:hypothetical protein